MLIELSQDFDLAHCGEWEALFFFLLANFFKSNNVIGPSIRRLEHLAKGTFSDNFTEIVVIDAQWAPIPARITVKGWKMQKTRGQRPSILRIGLSIRILKL